MRLSRYLKRFFLPPNKLDPDYHFYGRLGYLTITRTGGGLEIPVTTLLFSTGAALYLLLHPRVQPPPVERWSRD